VKTKKEAFLKKGAYSAKWATNCGAALLTVIFVTTIISLIVGSLLKWGIQDQKINTRHFVLLEARNAAEAMTEISAGVLSYRWESQTSVPEDDLENNPLDDEPAIKTELDKYFPSSRFDIDVKGGSVTQGRFYIHPDDPAHADDPHKGKLVTVQSVTILAKAAVDDPLLSDPMTAYARQTLQVRDAPLFSHAVFYNMDLEFHPGPQMVMNGPVHANGDVWVQAVNQLTFTSNLTATNDFRYGYMLNDGNSNQVTQNGAVLINNGEGDLSSPYRGSGNKTNIASYWDSQSPSSFFTDEGYLNWADFAMNRWKGNLQDRSHEVPILNPIGYDNYVRDDPSTPGILDDDLNFAYALIEPNITDPTGTSGLMNPVHKGNGEEEKFAFKAGLIIKVHYSEDGSTTSDGGTLPADSIQLRERKPMPINQRVNPDDPHNPNSNWSEFWSNFDNTGSLDPETNGTLGPATDFYLSFWKIDRGDAHNLKTTNFQTSTVQAVDKQGQPVVDGSGDPVMVDVKTVQEIPLRTDVSPWWRETDFHDTFAVQPYDEYGNSGNTGNGVDTGDNGDPSDSLFDHRRGAGIDMVEINVDRFRRFIEDDDAHGLFSNWDGSVSSRFKYAPDQEFNGVLYVEFPTDTDSIPGNADYQQRPDKVVKSARVSPRDSNTELGLILTNASRIPDPAYNKVAGRDPGFTLATNSAIYVKGHYNADGDPDTGSNTESDESSVWNPNPPAALVGDAIMPLSPHFGSLGTKDRSADSTGFTEFNAAIIQGLRPTDKGGDGRISGGNHNFPRFLEDWGGIEFRYRGSMVSLFESEIATQGTNTAYYSPPIRNWGFYELFGSGVYPPGTPNVRSFRKMNFRFVTKAEYEELLDEMD